MIVSLAVIISTVVTYAFLGSCFYQMCQEENWAECCSSKGTNRKSYSNHGTNDLLLGIAFLLNLLSICVNLLPLAFAVDSAGNISDLGINIYNIYNNFIILAWYILIQGNESNDIYFSQIQKKGDVKSVIRYFCFLALFHIKRKKLPYPYCLIYYYPARFNHLTKRERNEIKALAVFDNQENSVDIGNSNVYPSLEILNGYNDLFDEYERLDALSHPERIAMLKRGVGVLKIMRWNSRYQLWSN